MLDLPRNLTWRRRRITPLPKEEPGLTELARRMHRFDLFAPLPEALCGSVAKMARIESFRAGEVLWHQGEPNRRVLFIERGLAKTERRIRKDLSRTYGLYGPGDSMGIYALWTGMRYPTDAVALNDGMTALTLSADALVQAVHDQPLLSVPLMEEIGRFTEAFIRKIEIVSAGTVPQRIASFMVMLVERYGTQDGDGSAHLPIYLTLTHIGEIVDARLETVARVLGDWKRQGWLVMEGDGFHFQRFDRICALLPE